MRKRYIGTLYNQIEPIMRYQVILKIPQVVYMDGKIIFKKPVVVYETRRLKRAIRKAEHLYETESGHEFRLLRNCYEVKLNRETIKTFGYTKSLIESRTVKEAFKTYDDYFIEMVKEKLGRAR